MARRRRDDPSKTQGQLAPEFLWGAGRGDDRRRSQAEELVLLREMVLLPVETPSADPEDSDELPPAWRYRQRPRR